MARGLLVGSGGETSAVNIRGIGFQERKDLFERLLKSADEDNDKFLMKLRDRIDRVGIQLPAIEVRFEHLNVSAEAYGFLNYLHILRSKKKHLSILQDNSGIIKP